MAETHELRLKIDAGAAKRGAREFTGALETVKRAVRDLDRDTDGLFTKLKKTSTAPTGRNSQAAALTSIRTAARQAESQVATLQRQLNRTGNAAGINRTDKALANFRQEMSAGIKTTEELRLAKDRLAQTLHEVRESARAANEVQRLRTAYQRTTAALDPLTTGTHAYRRAVLSAEQAARAGAISESQKTRTIAKAREAYLSAGAAAENYAAQQARLYGTRAGWGLGPGMGRQLGLQVNQMAQVAGMSTSVEQALKGISYQAADVGLAFGAAGIAIGSVAGVLLPVLIDRIFDVIPPTLSFKEAMDNLNESIEAARTAAGRTGDYTALRDEYGAVTIEVLRLIEVQKQLAQIDALSDLRAARDALSGESAEIGWLKSLAGYADTAAGRARRLRDELDLTKEAATTLESLWSRSRATNNAEELADLYAEMRQTIIDSAGGVENLTGAQGEHVRKLTEAEDAARRTTGAIAGATDQTYAWAGAMAGVRMEIAAILSSLASIGGGLIGNASKNAELTALQAGKSVRAAAVERERFLFNQKMAAKEMQANATGGVAGWALKQGIESERFQFNEGLRLDAELDKARAAAREAAKTSKGGGGGGRKGALTEEQKAVEDLNKSLKDRLTSLQEERIELDLVASGQFETAEGARAMAEAMVAGGGAVDAQTAAMIRQIDAAAKLNQELKKVSEDPVKKWRDSVPTWKEAATEIEMGAINHVRDALSEMIQTGKFDIEALGEAILGTIADIVADKATKELHTLLGGADRENGGLFGGLFGNFNSIGDPEAPAIGGEGAGVVSGGQQAATAISSGMIQAGQQVSQQLTAAMTQGGQQAGQQTRMGHVQGGQTAANATRMAGMQHGQQVRSATMTSGQQHATKVKTAIETGGQQHAQMIRGASASGGGGGGGLLSGLFGGDGGGIGGILSMTLGAFDVGGISTAPANFTRAPISAFRHAPHFAQGTPNTSGIPAILHPNEAVVNLTKGRKIPVELNGDPAAGGGGQTVNHFNWNVQTPDADSFRRSQKQLASDAFNASRRAAAANE